MRNIHRPTQLAALTALALLAPVQQASAAGKTSVSIGVDVARGDYGSPETTSTYSLPVSIKHESGPWTLRASVPLVHAEGTFNRELGDDSGGGGGGSTAARRTESGLGDLSLAAYYTVLNNPSGYSVDLGAKAKLATADKAKTLIATGADDFSWQVDVFRALPSVALFATLGYTFKGEPSGVSYTNPFYSSLGFSLPLSSGRSIGASWDYRQKLSSSGDPINELSAFYSAKLDPKNKMQFYLVHGLSNGSPDIGGGVVFTHSY